jgi:hypothetical protein
LQLPNKDPTQHLAVLKDNLSGTDLDDKPLRRQKSNSGRPSISPTANRTGGDVDDGLRRQNTLSSFRVSSPYAPLSPTDERTPSQNNTPRSPHIITINEAETLYDSNNEIKKRKSSEESFKRRTSKGSQSKLLTRNSTLSSFRSPSPRDVVASPTEPDPSKPMTPIPMGGLIAVCFIFMCEGFNYCFLFPVSSFLFF